MPRMRRMTKEDRAQWLACVRRLKQQLPAAFPVVVRTRVLPRSLCGDAALVRRGRQTSFEIRISAELTWLERIETLIHEYAHCLNWSHRHERLAAECHDETWGVWYAKAYRVLEEF